MDLGLVHGHLTSPASVGWYNCLLVGAVVLLLGRVVVRVVAGVGGCRLGAGAHGGVGAHLRLTSKLHWFLVPSIPIPILSLVMHRGAGIGEVLVTGVVVVVMAAVAVGHHVLFVGVAMVLVHVEEGSGLVLRVVSVHAGLLLGVALMRVD